MPRKKQPAFQFYPGDWMKDPNLRRCSRAARGLWIDMLCIMFECEDRGVLASGNRPWTDEEVAAAVGGDIADGLARIAELLDKGVAHRNLLGAIFSRRMVRDEQTRRKLVAAGKRGGNPLLTGRDKPLGKGDGKGDSKGKQTPSSSSSDLEKGCENSRAGPAVVPPFSPIVADLIQEFFAAPYRGPQMEQYRLHRDAGNAIQSAIEAGISPETIRAEIKRPDRNRGEFAHTMTNRLISAHQKRKPPADRAAAHDKSRAQLTAALASEVVDPALLAGLCRGPADAN